MADKSIIVIGAGIAGLSVGCYGQMNGYRTYIFEQGNLPGGLCTSWKHQGYTIDGCLQWLVGSSPVNNFYRIWEELGAIQDRRIINHEEFLRIEGASGKSFILYSDIDRLEQHMKEIAPEDKKVIDEFIKEVRICTHFDMPINKVPELYSAMDGMRMLFKMFPALQVMKKWRKVSVQDFAKRFKNPFLREVFSLLFTSVPDFPMFFMLMVIAWMHQKSAGYLVGGSLEFARAIEKRYLRLGGEIHYNSRVAKILVENDCAVGIRLEDGSEHRADYIISAADGHQTIFEMLEGKYVNEKIRGYYDKHPVFPPIIHVALGVARSFEEMPWVASGIDFPLEKSVNIGGEERKRLGVHIYNFDPTLAPPGKSVIKVMLSSDYNYWKLLEKDPVRYQEEKEKIADTVISILDKRFLGLAAQVEMCDVATPLTFERRTGNWKGSYQGWLVTTKTLGLRMSKTLPGLKNFYMAGQWVEPGGGIPPAALSGRNVIQLICRQDKKSFVTSVP